MTSPVLPARFPARRLLKVVSLVVGGLVLGLLIAIVALLILREGTAPSAVGWAAVPFLLLPGVFVFRMAADAFSVLEVDERGIHVRKWIGAKTLTWEAIGSVRSWEEIQVVQGAQSLEVFMELRSLDHRRLLRLKSSYEPAAYTCVIECARARHVRVDLARASLRDSA